MSLLAGVSPALAGRVPTLPPDAVIFGEAPKMQAVRRQIEKVAAANIPVLVEGESGTGKELIARLLHDLSPWSSGPFVKVNCPAIPGTLVESELFGYEKGAFTGAYGAKRGRVEMASPGTLFLDEIGEMDLDLQSKLLQVLQDGQFCRIGAQEDKRLEARVVCATNRELRHEIAAGAFRQDLFYRINVVNVQLPALRERPGDIVALTRYFIHFYNAQFQATVPVPATPILKRMESYAWPGNIRELENVVKRYVILGNADAINEAMHAHNGSGDPFQLDFPGDGKLSLKVATRDAVRKFERTIILQALNMHQWNRKKTARALSISYRSLLYKLREAGLQTSDETLDENSSLAEETL